MSFITTNSNIKNNPLPLLTVMVNNAEMQSLKVDYTASLDKKPYVVCNIEDPDNKTYYLWSGTDWVNMAKKQLTIDVDFAINGIYQNQTRLFEAIPLQVLLCQLSDYGNFTKIEAKICVSYACTGVSTAEFNLFDYTDSLTVPNSTFSVPSGIWVYASSDFFDITTSEGKALRLQSRKVGGTGGDSVNIEACSLVIKLS